MKWIMTDDFKVKINLGGGFLNYENPPYRPVEKDMELIREEDGTIRKCDSNIVKLGYWRSLWLWYGYKKTLVEDIDWGAVAEAFVAVGTIILALILLPFIPFIRCYTDWKRAKYLVSKEAKEKIDELHRS